MLSVGKADGGADKGFKHCQETAARKQAAVFLFQRRV